METLKNQRLRVVEYDPEAKQFKVEFENKEYTVRQTGQEVPEFLNCRVTQNDQEVEVTREIEEYFHAGAVRRFTVRSDMRESAGVYELVDDCGFVVYLYGAEQYSFFKGKELLCNVVTTEGIRPYVVLRERLEVTGTAFSISKEYLKTLLKERTWDVDALCDLILYDGMNDPFDVKCYGWVTAQTSLYKDQEELENFLKDVRGCCMDALEKTELLRKCSQDEVGVLLDRMTLVIEHLGYAKTALETIAKGEEENYIEDIFTKLKNSGILYHPTKHFCIATYLFRNNPNLMKSKIGELFDVVRSHDLKHWKKEPFRIELIKQLEAFVKVNDADISESPDNQDLYYLGFQALAIQLLLAHNEEDLIDVPLNRSMMYRYASHFAYANRRRMADMSLNALQGLYSKKAAYSLNDTESLEKLYFCVDNWGRSQEIDRNRKAIYRSKDLVLRVESDKITIAPDVDLDLRSALYDDVKLWHGIDVLLEKQYAATPYRQKGSDLMQLNSKLWTNVERSLFNTGRVVKKVERKYKTLPEAGDFVWAYVYKQDENDGNKFYCRIDDEDFVGEGYIYVRTDDAQTGIVNFNVDPVIGNFMDEEGNPYLLEMKVVGKTDDEVCIMDMKEVIRDYLSAEKPNFHLDCKLVRQTSDSTFIAATNDCMPVYMSFSPKENYLVAGDHVKVLLRDGNKWFSNGFIQGKYSCKSEERYTANEAFATLIRKMSDGVFRMDVTDPAQNEVMLDRSQVVELMNIIDEIASVEKDNHVCYNYLGFAKMISKMIGDEDRATYYEGLMEVAQMLHKFAVTNVVDNEQLANLQDVRKEQLKTNYNLRYQYNTLKAVGYMGGMNDDWLLYLSTSAPDEQQRKLASLVYSYNVLNEAGLSTDELKKTIKEHLNLKGRDAYFKVYEMPEGEEVEFKTSIVYAAGSMKEDLEKQTKKIMKEISAFLNHKGGTLYLGVNDQGGGQGLEEDMRHKLFNDSRDKYDNYVRNKIVEYLGSEASHCIKARFDDDARGRDIYILSIDPCPNPVKFEGKYYQRQGSQCRQVDKDYLKTFLQNRSGEYRQLMLERGEMMPDAEAHAQVDETQSGVIPAAVQTGESSPAENPVEWTPSIKTGTQRCNLLHEYEYEMLGNNDGAADDEYTVQSYIHLMHNSKYMIEHNDSYQEMDHMLTLAVHPSEVHGYLLLVYEDGKVAKVPMNRILDKEELKPYIRHADVPLRFACPVNKNDVLFATYEYKGETYYRLQDVSTFMETNIGDPGQEIFDVPFEAMVMTDVIPERKVHELPKRITDRKRLGSPTSKKEGAAIYAAVKKLGLLNE